MWESVARISGSKATPLEDLGCMKRGIAFMDVLGRCSSWFW